MKGLGEGASAGARVQDQGAKYMGTWERIKGEYFPHHFIKCPLRTQAS